MSTKEITVPDIGTDAAVKIIEINVKVGDSVAPEDALITLESEKASMEIPAPFAGVVKEILVSVGDSITTGKPILVLDSKTVESEPAVAEIKSNPEPKLESSSQQVTVQQAFVKTENVSAKPQQVNVPDIGTDAAVKIIEINVKVGDQVEAEDALITLESEKASMEIPAPFAGVVKELLVNIGDSITTGRPILILEGQGSIIKTADKSETESAVKTEQIKQPLITEHQQKATGSQANVVSNSKNIYASPSVRRFANELGVDLTRVIGTARKHRITKEDIEKYVKGELAKTQSGNANGSSIDSLNFNLPEIDFTKFGEVSVKPLSRIQKYSAVNLHRNWMMIPHVTQFDEADITDLEAFRLKYKKQVESKGYKLTPIVFLMKAAAQALKALPKFNVSLSPDGNNFIQKHYYHIGIAVDTPNGLVVPVIRDVDQKGLFQLAKELAEISQKARDGKLLPKEMQGSCFTISSLGGIGGTAFTPIVNYPDVAILGVSKSQYKPVYIEDNFVPRLMLPLSLSYDHRAIDGADGARFITLFSQYLADISQLLL